MRCFIKKASMFFMDVRIEKIINAFENKGWILNGSIEVSGDWWFEDIPELVSRWGPVENQYLFDVVD
jgi:hypothetical protein